ncbi:hypothetical protein SCP_1002370 [Sparassis crispa]|uniref:Uncharacterized protein n=1 Tax=Sparassis crispa TaxID=139825 RepID=A0A401GXR3_9APHY|nr:hypothetical protein SCP_1002370 [Sparassis crispa]GBE86991.1 hypothetical protein SCP_1002370 [Sparassis crispa]
MPVPLCPACTSLFYPPALQNWSFGRPVSTRRQRLSNFLPLACSMQLTLSNSFPRRALRAKISDSYLCTTAPFSRVLHMCPELSSTWEDRVVSRCGSSFPERPPRQLHISPSRDLGYDVRQAANAARSWLLDVEPSAPPAAFAWPYISST